MSKGECEDAPYYGVLDALYGRSISSTRCGPVFNAHNYPTKINTAAIVPFILAHTKPGDLVFDGFAGSGSTGLAASLCANPDPDLKKSVEGMLGPVNWGNRNLVLYDISQLATFISSVLLEPPDTKQFSEAANQMLSILDANLGWMYAASDVTGHPGSLRHVLWTDFPVCPHCGKETSFYDLAVSLDPPNLASDVVCPNCSQEFNVAGTKRLTEEFWDSLLERAGTRRVRRPVLVYGRSGKHFWRRTCSQDDFDLIRRIDAAPVPSITPIVRMLMTDNDRWGELYRRGYHYGINHLHHLYTRRNLIAVAAAWELAENYPERIRNALQFWISSYNASHSTLMTRVVCKKNAKDFVVTSAQPAALYVSSLPVEKNVFAGLRTKMKPILSAFQQMQGRAAKTTIKCASSLKVDLPDASVDYIFTDPPFGYNIQYSEVNFIGEAWLRRVTNRSEEVIISPHQGKSVREYQSLLAGTFAEAFRILKPGHHMTVVFHSADPDVWNALRAAWELAGFEMIRSSILEKTQASFKQTTAEQVVKGDPIILLRKPHDMDVPSPSWHLATDERPVDDPWDVIAKHLSGLDDEEIGSAERTRQRLYSYLVTYYLKHGQSVPLNARTFFVELNRRFGNLSRESYYLK